MDEPFKTFLSYTVAVWFLIVTKRHVDTAYQSESSEARDRGWSVCLESMARTRCFGALEHAVAVTTN